MAKEVQVPMRLDRTAVLTALAIASILVAAPAAQATTHHHRSHHHLVCKRGHVARRVHRHHRRVWRCEPTHRHHHRRHHARRHTVTHNATPQAPIRVAAAPRAAPPITPTNPVLGYGGGAFQGCSGTPEPEMRVERVIVYWFTPIDLFAECAASAHTAGLKLIVSVQYDARWTMAQIKERFRQVLAVYGPDDPYAVSIGNEQELGTSGGSPASYHRVWDAVEPIIAATDPQAIRVAGEISPWGLAWFEQAAALGLPGAQAYAAHVYPTDQPTNTRSPWTTSPAAFVQLAHAHHAAAWATEGMCGPDSWQVYGCQSRAALGHDGFALAIEWYAPTGSAA